MASETRATAESIRESARQVLQEYLAGRSVEGDDVANVAHDLDDAAAEIARLTAELDAAREREQAYREALAEVGIPLEAFWMAMHDSPHLALEVREAVRRALSIVRRALAATPPPGARAMAIRDENYEGDFNEDGALDEIARLTAELEKTEAALTIAKTTAANLHDVIRRKDRELEEARERERRLRDHAEAVAASALPPSRRTTRVGNEALAGLRRALASTPPDTEGDGGCTV